MVARRNISLPLAFSVPNDYRFKTATLNTQYFDFTDISMYLYIYRANCGKNSVFNIRINICFNTMGRAACTGKLHSYYHLHERYWSAVANRERMFTYFR